MSQWLLKLWINIVKAVEVVLSRSNSNKEPDRLSVADKDQKLLRYPIATQITPEFKSRGLYPKNYPEGAVVHFTAGRSKAGDEDAKNTVAWLRSEGLAAFVISATGTVYQAQELSKWGYHAGVSTYPGLGSGVSARLVGIEVCCAGSLERLDSGYKSWFGEKYVEGDVRHSNDKDNIKAGIYHRFTPPQENALIQLLLWLKSNNPDVFSFDYVVGHDETCVPADRKNDPGASLSMTMPELRALLKGKYEAMAGK